MILHSPIISGSLTFADGSTFTLPDNGIYSGSYSGSFQGTTYTGGTFIGNGSQLTFGGTGIVSGSSQLTNDLDSRYLNTNGEGVVSGSSQVTISGTTGYSTFSSSLDSRISTEKGRVDAILAASTADSDTFAEIVSLINSVDTTNDSAFASFYTASNATNDAQSARLSSIESVTGSYETKGRGIVSGSSQVVYASLSSIPAGIVSGSSQINLGSVSGNTTSNVTEGTNLYYTDARVKTKLNAEGVISGSVQVLGGTGIVSGSSQINLANASGNTTSNISEGSNLYYTDTRVKTKLTAEGVISGSSQVTLASTIGYTTFSSSVETKISTEKNRIDAILAASTADADTFAEIVALVNSVDTTSDTAFAGFVTSSNTTNTAQNNRLTAIESVTGSYELKGTGIISGSSQVTYASISSIPAGIVSGSSQLTPLLPVGVVSGSSQINLGSVNGNSTSNVTEGSNLYYTDARVKTKLNAESVVSGSSQITYASISSIPAGIVSGSSQVKNLLPGGVISGSSQLTTEFDSRYLNTLGEGIVSSSAQVTSLLPSGVVSGSVQVLGGTGVVSGSSQINLASVTGNTTTNVSEGTNLYYTDARVKSKLTAEGVISGSSQVTYASISSIPAGIVSGSAQVTPLLPAGIVSGSSQVTYASISSIPAGIVSGSSQINLASVIGNNTSNVSEGTNLYYTDARVKTKLNAEGVISGSSQVAISSTTGYTTFSSSVDSRIATEKTRVDAILASADANADTFAEIVTLINSVDTTSDTAFAGFVTSSNATDAAQNSRLTSIESVTGSFETKGRGIVSGSSQITYASISSIPAGIVSGSSQVTYASISSIPAGIVSGSSQISHDSTTGFVANKHIDHTAVSITAGNGLTGGGDISSTRTLNVVGGNGISVNADNIELAGTYTGTWAVTGGITATADVVAYASSDRRLKDNIKNIENPIEKVQQLNGVTWEWNSNADELQQSLPTVGVIAQEVEEVLPQLVHDRENGYKGVDYAKLTGLLIEAIKEQQKQIDELKSKLQ